MEPKSAVEVQALHKKFKNIVALDNINLHINEGEFVALLGPNGAGKSTLIKILIGVMSYDSGSVSVLGEDPLENRDKIISRLGIVFGQRSRLWHDLPVKESFDLTKRLYDVKDNQEWEDFLIDGIDIRKLLDRPVKKLSLGEKMRCELVNTLLYNPDLIFLDEPTIGLDVVSKQKIREFLQILHQSGKTILLTSHDTGDIEKLCERVMVINKGQVMVNLPIAEFMALDTTAAVVAKLETVPGKIPVRVQKLCTAITTISEYEIRFECKKIDRKKLLSAILDSFDLEDVDLESGGVEKILLNLYA